MGGKRRDRDYEIAIEERDRAIAGCMELEGRIAGAIMLLKPFRRYSERDIDLIIATLRGER